MKNAKDEISQLRRYAVPLLGEMEVPAVETAHINTVLDVVAEAGMGKETVKHVRQAMRAVFKQLKREGAVEHNPVSDAELPRMNELPRRERVILTDSELSAYLAYVPELERDAPGVLERQTMACVSRMFGGLRTGDLHALDWAQHIDTDTFGVGIAPRQKTATPQLLEIPEMLRPALRRWWGRHGEPDAGPVFPQRIGKRVGKARGKHSHARGLRRDLMRMMGLEYRTRELRTEKRHGATTRVERHVWARVPESQWSRRQRELLTDTEYSLRVDFHSFRRSYVSALDEAGVNVQTSMRLAGHTSMSAHLRYVMSRTRAVPEAALPRIELPMGMTCAQTERRERGKAWRSHGDLNPGYRRERPVS